jgi:hypothetical protein
MSSIFGEQTAKFLYGETEVSLDHCIVSPNFRIPTHIMHQSCLTGKRTYSKNENFISFKAVDYLFKYANPKSKADELLSYEDLQIDFYPFIDGNENKNVILEYIDIKSLDENDPTRTDIAIMNFVTPMYAKAFLNKIFTEEDGLFFEDQDGKTFTDG